MKYRSIRCVLEMNKNQDKVLKGEKVNLDFSEYEHCLFEECEIHLEYGITKVTNCEFKNCTLHLGGAASTVAMIIKLFYPDAFPVNE